MQDNLKHSKNVDEENRNIEENCNMVTGVQIDFGDEDKQEWKRVFDKLLVIDNKMSDEIDIEKLIDVIMSLNNSTISYWWRGGMTLNRLGFYFKLKKNSYCSEF